MIKSLLVLFFVCLIGSTLGDIGQVHISLTGKQGEMLANWVSDSPSDGTYVRWGLTASPDGSWQTASGNVTSYSFEGYTSGGLHSALMEGLQSSTVYYYQVGDGNNWSPVFFFKNAPPVGYGPLNIGFIGDVGADDNSNNTFWGLIDNRNNDGLDLVVHAGDLSYANNYNPGGPVWDRYGLLLEPLAAFTPYEPSVGNHETIDNFLAFQVRYDTSALEANSQGGDFFWSINFGLVHFIMLSSETDFSTSSAQYAWLQQDLQSIDRTKTPWVVATWHRPWYCSNHAHSGEGTKMRDSLEPLFYKYKVDIGVCGHVHAYERVDKMYNNQIDDKGTWYITNGAGGTPEGLATKWLAQPTWSAFRESEHWGYGNLKIFNATHAYWTFRSNDDHSVLDDFWYVRG